MKRPSYDLLRGLMSLFVLIFVSYTVSAQVSFKQPPPGSVYRDYSRIMTDDDHNWRVTDPNVDLTRWPYLAPYLPNPQLHISIDDLTDAVRAEAIYTIWGGHVGTGGKKVKFNGNNWIDIPPLSTANGIPSGHSGNQYMSQIIAVLDVPLGDLHTGDNYFEGTNTGQEQDPDGQGHHGWYGVIIRIYYDPAKKSHPTGSITSPSQGGTFGENPTFTVSGSGGGGVNRADILAYYDGYDTDGDGVFQEYHSDYHKAWGDQMEIHDHVGTATGGSPYNVNWTTTWLPDQAPGTMKLIAHIRDNNGIWYVTPEVTNLTFQRNSGSVRFYKPQNVPEWYWVKDGLDDKSSNFSIPGGDDLSKATDALFLIRSWNGVNGDAAQGTYYNLSVNSWNAPTFGQDHYYSFDGLSISPSELHTGSNTVKLICNSNVHGVEIMWPGPAMLVRFSVNIPVPIQLASFSAGSLSAGSVKLSWRTISETNNYGFEVQRSVDGGNYQTLANSFVAGHGTTLTPQQYSYTDATAGTTKWYYRLKQIDLDGTPHYSEGIQAGTSTGAADQLLLPRAFALEQNYPNPFNPSTVIKYALPEAGLVRIRVMNILGEVVKTLVDEQQQAGYHEVKFESNGLTSGIYLYELRSPGFSSTKKMMLLK